MVPSLIALTVNQIGDAGATQLADALHHNSALTTLYLYCKHDIIYVVISNIINIYEYSLFVNDLIFVHFHYHHIFSFVFDFTL